MIEFRTDDVILAGIAGYVLRLALLLLDLLETKKLISVGPAPLRSLFKTNLRLWLVTVAPSILILVGVIWLGLRAVMPENMLLSGGIFCLLWALSLGVSLAKLIMARNALKRQRAAAHKHLQVAEAHLKSLAEGPLIVDEELDMRVLKLQKQLAEVRESLGLKENNPENR